MVSYDKKVLETKVKYRNDSHIHVERKYLQNIYKSSKCHIVSQMSVNQYFPMVSRQCPFLYLNVNVDAIFTNYYPINVLWFRKMLPKYVDVGPFMRIRINFEQQVITTLYNAVYCLII